MGGLGMKKGIESSEKIIRLRVRKEIEVDDGEKWMV